MPLPSQNDRTPELGRTHVLKTNRARRGPGVKPAWIAGGLGVVALALGAYFIWGRGGSSQPVVKDPSATGIATNTATGTGNVRTPAGPTPPPVVTPKPEPKPVVLNQGGTSTPSSGLSSLGKAPEGSGTSTESGGTVPGGALGTTPGDQSPAGAPGADAKPTSPDFTSTDPSAPRATGESAPPPSAPREAIPASGSTRSVREKIEAGDSEMAKGNLVRARSIFSSVLQDPNLAAMDAEFLRSKVASINDDLVFSTKVTPGDPLAETYMIQSGDRLAVIARRQELAVDWRFIQRINKISNPGALRVGQRLKLVRGPFHAIVSKASYRLDLFQGPPDEPDQWLFIRSFRVGLGEGNGTPLGTFAVRANSKLINPHWVNPRTGERFADNDPKNPIGEHWIGLDGIGESAVHTGYGIHGTIDPQSIGKQMSMGCVRLAADDIAMLYEVLMDRVSVVKIVP
jgi:LysM repeat protein